MKLRYTCFIMLLCSLLVFNACSNNSTDSAESTGLTSESEISTVWNLLYYEDEFGDATDYAYISTPIDSIHRSPGSSSDGYAQVLIEHHFKIVNDSLVGYFTMSATRQYATRKYEITCPATIKLKIEEEVYTERLMTPSGYDICIDSYDEDTEYVYHLLYDALISGKDIQVNFEDYDNIVNIFTIESGNFKDAIESIYPQYEEWYKSVTK